MAAKGITFDALGRAQHEKDPDARLPYTWNFGGDAAKGIEPWLAAGETIVAASVAIDNPPAGTDAVVEGVAFTDTKVTAVLKGGRAGEKLAFRCRITTSLGYIDDRTVNVTIRGQ